jgi:hypothetical protein
MTAMAALRSMDFCKKKSLFLGSKKETGRRKYKGLSNKTNSQGCQVEVE